MFLAFFDRAGGCFSTGYDINKNPETFLRVLACMLFGRLSTIGFDPTIFTVDGIKQIQVSYNTYEIIRTVFKSGVIRGRGTTCWKVQRNEKRYVVKDIWLDTVRSKPANEVTILEKVKNLKGVPRIVEWAEVSIDNKTDTTDLRREMFGNVRNTSDPSLQQYLKLENRIHFRMVMEPFADPLWDFSSKRELISAFIDIVKSEYPILLSF
jgi:hypothetical protein